MTFQLDTSGAVIGATAWNSPEGQAARHREIMHGRPHGETVWSDLSPFTQGYIEALFASIEDRRRENLRPHVSERAPALSDLAPETLARIIADCEEWRSEFRGSVRERSADRADMGREAWRIRQDGNRRTFPPLTVQLGDDGKVRFADKGAEQ